MFRLGKELQKKFMDRIKLTTKVKNTHDEAKFLRKTHDSNKGRKDHDENKLLGCSLLLRWKDGMFVMMIEGLSRACD